MAEGAGRRKRAISATRWHDYQVSKGLTDDEESSPPPSRKQKKAEQESPQPSAEQQHSAPKPRRRALSSQPKALPPGSDRSASTNGHMPSQPAFELLKLPEEVLSIVCSHLSPKRLCTVCAVGAWCRSCIRGHQASAGDELARQTLEAVASAASSVLQVAQTALIQVQWRRSAQAWQERVSKPSKGSAELSPGHCLGDLGTRALCWCTLGERCTCSMPA